ncbi:hypothetical protein H0H93_008276 [Arthromyces matolae]|nr:hypothetical protein H0H93_008276 [Arthromyces matolae]
MSIFNGLNDSRMGPDLRCRMTQHVHEQFTASMVDAALSCTEQTNSSPAGSGRCPTSYEAPSSPLLDEGSLPPIQVSLLALPTSIHVEVEEDMVVLPAYQASSITDIETTGRCASPISQDLTPSAPIIAVEEPIKSQHPALLTVPEPVSTSTDSAKSTEQSTPAPRSPKTPSTLGPLSYLHSSPLPSLPSLPPLASPPASPTLPHALPGLGLRLASLPSQASPPPKASTDVSPIIKTHTPRKPRPDSSQYLLSPPPSELFDTGRHIMKTDKISELPNHFLSLPFAEGFFEDMVSTSKRNTVTPTSEPEPQSQVETGTKPEESKGADG